MNIYDQKKFMTIFDQKKFMNIFDQKQKNSRPFSTKKTHSL